MGTLPSGALMQRAAAGLAAACADFLGGSVYGARMLVLVGSGDNGGDALFAGARLARRGAEVTAVLVTDSAHPAGLADLLSAGGRIVQHPPQRLDLVLDGIVGIGGQPGLRGRAGQVVEALSAPVVAVDVPSGVGVDSGQLDGTFVSADLTVTFGTHKVAHFVEPAASAAGVVELVDIGLGPYLGEPVLEVLQTDDVRRLVPSPPAAAHKYSRGVVGVAAGSAEYPGAGLLAVGAAVATGLAGMVRYAGASADLVRQQHPEVVIGSGQVQSWVVGPGLGPEAVDTVERVLSEQLPTVVDADGLRAVPERLAGPAILTPHAGELARLLDVSRDEVERNALASARTAASRWHAVVVLKGPHTVVAAPDGRVRVNTTGVPWLATAGAGDVLAGVIGTLLAAGLDCFDAASVGAWLHGSAAALASGGGPISATAVAAALPATLRATLDAS
jgi:ADP-dependent NAD(P)H-hydrate dehydratase / NAD(P)H-hydrate epimerase